MGANVLIWNDILERTHAQTQEAVSLSAVVFHSMCTLIFKMGIDLDGAVIYFNSLFSLGSHSYSGGFNLEVVGLRRSKIFSLCSKKSNLCAFGLLHSHRVIRHVTSSRAILLAVISTWKYKDGVIWLLSSMWYKIPLVYSFDIYDSFKVSSSFFRRVCKTWQVSCNLGEYI